MTFLSLRKNGNNETIIDRIRKAFLHFVYTMADIGAVGLVRYLIGTYASSVTTSALISIVISFQISRLRKGKSKMFKALNNTED